MPSTLVSNDHALLAARAAAAPWITKPVNGGDYARELAAVLEIAPQKDGSLAAPSIAQERLVPPGDPGLRHRRPVLRLPAHRRRARLPLHRRLQGGALPLGDLEPGIVERLGALMTRLDLDYGAADFKADPQTGRLRFLEINNGPMFSGFDATCAGQLSGAIADFLSGT